MTYTDDDPNTEFQPARSTRVTSAIEALEDKWVEYLTICEIVNPRTNKNELEIRSFFESTATKEKVWDEPPSGALNTVWASDEAKEMATAQILDLQLIKANETEVTGPDESQKKKKFSIKNIFKRKNITIRAPEGRMVYKPGSNMDLFVGKSRTEADSVVDEQLQLATSESLRIEGERVTDMISTEEDEDIALAIALSISEVEEDDRKPAAK